MQKTSYLEKFENFWNSEPCFNEVGAPVHRADRYDKLYTLFAEADDEINKLRKKPTKPIFNHDEESVLKAIGSKLTQEELHDYECNAFKELVSIQTVSEFLECIYNLDLSTIEKMYITYRLENFIKSISPDEEEVKC